MDPFLCLSLLFFESSLVDPEVPGICEEIPFPQVKRVAELSFPKLPDATLEKSIVTVSRERR